MKNNLYVLLSTAEECSAKPASIHQILNRMTELSLWVYRDVRYSVMQSQLPMRLIDMGLEPRKGPQPHYGFGLYSDWIGRSVFTSWAVNVSSDWMASSVPNQLLSHFHYRSEVRRTNHLLPYPPRSKRHESCQFRTPSVRCAPQEASQS